MICDPLHPDDDEYREHIRRLVDDAPPLPAAAADLWRRAKESAARPVEAAAS